MMNRLLTTLIVLLLWAGGVANAQFTEQRVWGGTSGGSANAQTITIPNMTSTTPPVGVPVCFIAGNTNTNTATLAVSGGTARNVYKATAAGPTALAGGEIISGQVVCAQWNGTQYQITSATDASATQIRGPPQGYLTPCPTSSPPTGCTAGQITPTGDVTVGVAQSVTGIVYTPYTGNQVPIYNGSNMVMTAFSELTLTLASSHVANAIYDVCVFNDSGTVRLGTGPAWSTSTAGSGTRGTGAGTAQISRVQGFWTNAVSITATNGASTYSVAVNQCTIVGTILVSGSNGVLTYHRTWGQSRVWPSFNFYNRQDVALLVGDSTSSWTYSSATIRPANNDANNKMSVLVGLAEEIVDFRYTQRSGASSGNPTCVNGFGYNATAAYTGTQSVLSLNGTGAFPAVYNAVVSIGRNDVTALEANSTASGTCQFFGTQPNMLMLARWRG